MSKTEGRIIFVSGGVVSGIGKGTITSSLALLIKARGFTVSPIKCDMYINVDAGTMNPTEHGEVFVTEDGIETDQDIGTYERFLNQPLRKENYTTTGQVYQTVIQRERQLKYEGRCVEVVPDIPEEIIGRILEASKGVEFTFVELGGTVGEYQTVLFLEATRILAKRLPGRTVHIHVSHFPYLKSLGELKSKPTQLSIRKLNESGIVPDFVVARSEKTVDAPRFNTLCQNSNLTPDEVIFCPDVDDIYKIPLMLEEQKFPDKVLMKLGLGVVPRPHLDNWINRLDRLKSLEAPTLRIGIIEKYRNVGEYTLSDTHISVLEAIKHAAIEADCNYEINWINSEKLNQENLETEIGKQHGIIVPQAWGARGSEGKIHAIRHARLNKIPFLGLCYGMQMAVVEFGMTIGLDSANSTEIDPKTPHPVIHIMPEQEEIIRTEQFGGTIRLGSYPCILMENSKLSKIYKKNEIKERHRHRYEFNNKYRQEFEKKGMIFSGLSPDSKLVEAIEIPDHPFFIGVQFHPEFQSSFEKPHPLFLEFLRKAKESSETEKEETIKIVKKENND